MHWDALRHPPPLPPAPPAIRYSAEWEKTVHRLGRWIDFKNDYKTLDPSFMESVWWVFKQLHEKGLVYKGFKVRAWSTATLCACGPALDRCLLGCWAAGLLDSKEMLTS